MEMVGLARVRRVHPRYCCSTPKPQLDLATLQSTRRYALASRYASELKAAYRAEIDAIRRQRTRTSAPARCAGR